jgi:hypothetical protein
MTIILKDGKGKGYSASVDADNRLRTKTTNQPQIAFHTDEKSRSYFLYGKRNISTANTNEGILYIKYTGITHLHIDRIIFSTNSSNAKFEIFVNVDNVSNGNVCEPVNMDLSSDNSISSTCLRGLSTSPPLSASGITDDNEFLDVRLSIDTIEIPVAGALKLGKNDNIFIQGEAVGVGDKLRCNIQFWEEED